MAEVLATCISVDNTRALVTMGELGQYKEVKQVVVPEFSGAYKDAMVIGGGGILTLRQKRNAKIVRKHSQYSRTRMEDRR